MLLADIFQRRGDLVRGEQAARAALELFLALPLDDQAQWVDQLSDGLERSESASVVASLRQELTRKMIGIEWARANLKGMMHFRKAELKQAREAFAFAYRMRQGNPSVGLNLVQAELELLKRGSSPGPMASIRCCDDVLHGIQYAALSQRQQQRHTTLAERLATQMQQFSRNDQNS